MNIRSQQRLQLGLTQSEAASKAKVSLSTWRRWEENPESVSNKNRLSCEQVLTKKEDFLLPGSFVEQAADFVKAWGNHDAITARQAFAIAVTLDCWADGEIDDWLSSPDLPLGEIAPFSYFDPRVLLYIEGNRTWVSMVGKRCRAVSNEMQTGVLPFFRKGRFIDELLVGTAMHEAKSFLQDDPEFFELIPARDGDSNGSSPGITDSDWDALSDWFDDICLWDDWKIPLIENHPLLRNFLERNHPFTWFDPTL